MRLKIFKRKFHATNRNICNMRDYYQNKIFKTFESFNQIDPWDEEELGETCLDPKNGKM